MLEPEYFFSHLPEIITPRLLLRKLNMRDATDMYEYSRDPEVARHVLWDAHVSPSESRTYIRYSLRRARLGEPCSWGIEHRASGKLIGKMCIRDRSEPVYRKSHQPGPPKSQFTHGFEYQNAAD